MITTIKIDDDHPIEIDASINWMRIYRDQFGHDIMGDMVPLINTVISMIDASGELDFSGISEITSSYMIEGIAVPQVLWAMARNAKDVGTPENFYRWMGTFPLDIILPELGKVILSSFVSEKNRNRLLEVLKTAIPEASGSKISSSQPQSEG